MARRLNRNMPIPVPLPIGFAINGATNTALKAMIAGVRAGTRRGRIVWKGDSTTVGQGGGTGAPFYLAGARPNRVPAVLASMLSTAGVPTLDNAMVGDNGMLVAGSYPLASYDPRYSAGNAVFQTVQDFAGGAYQSPRETASSFTPSVAVDRFEVVVYNSNAYALRLMIDGAAPASIAVTGSTGSPAATVASANSINVSASGNGYTRLKIMASSAGTRTLSWAEIGTTGGVAVRSVLGYASGTPAIDMLVHAALNAQASQQGKDNSGSNFWGGLDALGFDVPDLTIINCYYNESAQGISQGVYQAALQSMVTKAKLSGDVLIVFPPPATSPYNNSVATYLATAAGVASSNNVSFMSLYDYYAGVADTSRFADAQVHPTAAFNVEVAGVLKQAVMAMVA